MSITLSSIINENWNNPEIDTLITQWITTHKVLKYIWTGVMDTPFISAVDNIVQDFETRLLTRKQVIDENDMWQIYKDIYYYTQIQSNIAVYLNWYRNKVTQMKQVLEIFTELQKQQFENLYNSKLDEIYKERDKELTEFESNYTWKEISTNEMKFVTMKLNSLNSKYDSKIAQYTWMRFNSLVNSQLKTSSVLNEIRRKLSILEAIVWYFELRFKNFQEEIMSWKKVIDNLSFLYKYANG